MNLCGNAYDNNAWNNVKNIWVVVAVVLTVSLGTTVNHLSIILRQLIEASKIYSTLLGFIRNKNIVPFLDSFEINT